MKRALWIAVLAAVLLAAAFRAGYRAGQCETAAETVVRVDTVRIERPAPDTVWRERTVVRWLARAEHATGQQTTADSAAAERNPVRRSGPDTPAPVAQENPTPDRADRAAVDTPTDGPPDTDSSASGGVRPAADAQPKTAPAADPPKPAADGGSAASGRRAGSAYRAEDYPAAVPAGRDSVWVDVPLDRYVFADSTYRAELTGFEVRMERMEVYPRTVVRTIRREPSRWGVSIGVGVGVTPSGRVEPALQLHVGWRLFPLGRRRER